MAEPAEIAFRIVGGDGFDRQLQAPASRLRDVARRDALLRDRVIDCAALGLFDRQPVEARDIGNMRRGPAVAPPADIGEHALGQSGHDPRADEPLPLRIVNLREPHHRHIDPVRGDGACRLFRSRARELLGGDRGGVLGRRLAGRDPGDRRSGSHDQRPIRAGEDRAQRLDDPPVSFAIGRELREVVIEREVDHSVRTGRAVLQAVRVRDRSAIDLGPGGGQGRRLLFRSIDADHLVAGRDQVVDDARADESGRAGDKHAHEEVSRVPSIQMLARGCSGKAVSSSG